MQRKCFHQKKWGVGNDLARTQHMNNDYRGMRPALIATPSQRARSWRTPLRAAKAQQERQLGGLSKLSKHGGLGDGTKRAAQQERRLGGLPKLSKNGGLGGPSKLSKNGGSVACQSSARTADLHGGLSKLGKSGRLGRPVKAQQERLLCGMSKLSKNADLVACQSSAKPADLVACQSSARTADLVACQSSARTADLVTAPKTTGAITSASNRNHSQRTLHQESSTVMIPSAGSPTETLLRLLLPLNDQV